MNLSNFSPSPDRILIKVIDETEVYDGSIILAETSQEKSNVALVLKVGDSVSKHFTDKKVMFLRNSGTVITKRFSDDEYRIIKETDILGIFE